jgi:hypothetical protein
MYEQLKSIADGPWAIDVMREIARITLTRVGGKNEMPTM